MRRSDLTDEEYKKYIYDTAHTSVNEFFGLGMAWDLAKSCARLKFNAMKINFDRNFGDDPKYEKVWDKKIQAFDDVLKMIEKL